jgi:hypothetical protein
MGGVNTARNNGTRTRPQRGSLANKMPRDRVDWGEESNAGHETAGHENDF